MPRIRPGIYIPHFCYHKKLSIAASCRMCLVEVEKAPKPLPACATPVTDGMKVQTRSPKAVTAQKGVMEFLLINHPLDCPICDQGGECQLQDIAVGYGGSASAIPGTEARGEGQGTRPADRHRHDPLHPLQPLRALRPGNRRHDGTGHARSRRAHGSHAFPGNPGQSRAVRQRHRTVPGRRADLQAVPLCARSWELSRRKSVSPHDGLGANVQVHVKNKVFRVVPQDNEAVNECWIADRDRFSYEALNSDQRLTSPW
jgi:NADH-quinone oxidoreductase subunit G